MFIALLTHVDTGEEDAYLVLLLLHYLSFLFPVTVKLLRGVR